MSIYLYGSSGKFGLRPTTMRYIEAEGPEHALDMISNEITTVKIDRSSTRWSDIMTPWGCDILISVKVYEIHKTTKAKLLRLNYKVINDKVMLTL